MKKDLQYYLSLKYTVLVKQVDDFYYGKIKELDGCQTTASSKEECLKELEQVKKDYLEIKSKYGNPIPEPYK